MTETGFDSKMLAARGLRNIFQSRGLNTFRGIFMELRRFKGHGGITLAADVGGDPANPAVILLHGAGQNRHYWAKAARALISAGRYVISLDLRGHGDSDWAADQDYSLDAFIADLLAVLEQVQVKPAIVGSMLGGLIGLTAIGERTLHDTDEIAGALILANSNPRIQNDRRLRITDFLSSRPEGFASLEDAAATLTAYRGCEPDARTAGSLRRNLRKREDGRWYWHYDPAVVANDNPKRVRLDLDTPRIERAAGTISAPTLLVRGRTNNIIDRNNVEELKALIPQAETAEVDEISNIVSGESGDSFDAEILSFLERVMRRPENAPPQGGIDPKMLRQALGCFCTGVTVVTTKDADGRMVGLTANSFTSVSLDPPLVLFCLDHRAASLPAFESSPAFAINVLHIGQQDISTRFVTKNIDRWADTPWEQWDTGVPIIQDAIASFECEKQQAIQAGDHCIFIGRVRRVWFDPSRDPLLYFQGKYRRVHVPH